MIAAQQVFAKMNEYGRRGEPFVFVIDFGVENAFFFPLPADADQVLYQCNALSNAVAAGKAQPFAFSKNPISFDEYRAGFELIGKEISDGNISLINYTKPTPIETTLSLKDIFLQSRARYKLWIKDCFVCFSPEIFVQIKNGRISTNPMKGTIDAALFDAASVLLNDPKELEEHQDCVDLLCEDLVRVATDIRVERFRYIDRIETGRKALLQVSSEISGQLPKEYLSRLGDIMKTLLPAGSIIGTPKDRSIEVLKQAEGYERRFYTGVFGIFDGEALDSGVLIRFIEQTPAGLVYKSGGGITAKSIAESEYRELIDKVYVPIY